MPAIRRPDRGGEWWIDFRYRGHRVRKRAPVQTKRAAEAFERSVRNELVADDEAGRDPFAGPPPTFGEFAERWMREYVAVQNRPASRRSKDFALRMHLLPAFGQLRLDEITTAAIDAFSAHERANGLAPKTINNILSMLRCALTGAVRWGVLRRVPEVRWLKAPPPETKFLSAIEIDQLLSAASAGYWKTLVTFIARTGARFGEAAALGWDDLELEGQRPLAHLRHAVSLGEVGPTKTGRSREVPLGPDAATALRAFRHENLHVFGLRDGKFPRPESTLKYLHKFCDRAGIRRVSWHVLRHSFATELTRRGGSLRTVQELLGHTTLQMTARYLHVAPSMLHETVALLYQAPIREPDWSPNRHQEGRGNVRSPERHEGSEQISASQTQKPTLEVGPCNV